MVYSNKFVYFLYFSCGKDSAIVLFDMLKQGISRSNIHLIIHENLIIKQAPMILDYYSKNFNMLMLGDGDDGDNGSLFSDYVKHIRSLKPNKTFIGMKGDADKYIRSHAWDIMMIFKGLDLTCIPQFHVDYSDIWIKSSSKHSRFIISGMFLPQGHQLNIVEITKYIGTIMSGEEYFKLLMSSSGINALRFQTILISHPLVGDIVNEVEIEEIRSNILSTKCQITSARLIYV